MYVDSSTSVRVKAGESERLRNDFGVRQVCIMFPWIFNVYIDAAKKEVKMGIGRRGVIFLQEESKWRLLGLLYAEVYKRPCVMRPMVGRFVEVCRRRELKINADKTKVMVLNGEEGLEFGVHVDGIRLKHFSEFKYLGCALESVTDGAECSRKVASGRIVTDAIGP